MGRPVKPDGDGGFKLPRPGFAGSDPLGYGKRAERT